MTIDMQKIVSTRATVHLQVLPLHIPLLWQLTTHKHIVSIPELLRCHTIIMVNFNIMHTQNFRL